MFEALNERLTGVFDRITGRGALSEKDVAEAMREDLELYAVGELEERIAALEAVVARCRAQIERKRVGRAAADALFSKPG